MFNIQGSELIFLLLVALVVLGPEKLPEAVRKFTKAYSEFKKMANGFQGELKQVLDEPMRELRDTADAVREAAKFEFDADGGDSSGATPAARPSSAARPITPRRTATPGVSEVATKPAAAARRDNTLNFGTPAARRQTRIARADDSATDGAEPPEVAPQASEPAPPAEDASE